MQASTAVATAITVATEQIDSSRAPFSRYVTGITLRVHLMYQKKWFFYGKGPRSRSYGRTAALSRTVQPCDDYEVFSAFSLQWSTGETKLKGEN